MNPKSFEYGIDRFNEAMAVWEQAENGRKQDAANRALDDLCAALGAELPGVSFDSKFEFARVPVKSLQLIASRLQALAAGDALADGRL